MKKALALSILFFLSGEVICQTVYFNNRYPVEGHWGNANAGIVAMDSAYFISPNNLRVPSPFRKNLIMNIGLEGADTTITSFIGYDSIDVVNTGILKTSYSGMVNAWSMYDLDSFNYAIAFYNEFGFEERLSINQKRYSYIFIRDIQETSDHGFILTGIVQELPNNQGGSEDVVLIRTDSLGNELWFKTLGGAGQQQGYSVAVCDDGGYIIAARDDKRIWIIRTDSTGTLQWDRFYGSTEYYNWWPQRIIQTSDGGYVFGSAYGTSDFTPGASRFVPWIQKLDAQGDSLWSWKSTTQIIDGIEDFINDIIELEDGSLVACGQERIINPIDSLLPYKGHGMLLKFSADGDSIWQHHYYHPEASNPYASHFLYRVAPTSDGGYVAAGYFAEPDTGTQDSWVIKVDSNGCLIPGCLITAVEHEPPLPKDEVLLYPNPARDHITLEISPQRPEKQQFVLYDMQGRTVLNQRINSSITRISVEKLPSGVYLYRLGKASGKLMVY